MTRNLILAISVSALAFAFAGCNNDPDLTADDTVGLPDPTLGDSPAAGYDPAFDGPGSTLGPDVAMNRGVTDQVVDFGDGTGLSLRDPAFENFEDGQLDRNVLLPVYFGFDQAAITSAQEREKLANAADYLTRFPDHRLLIEGHCDWRGTPEYNLSLGDRRANAAMEYLETLGVSPDRIRVKSKGDLEATIEGSASEMAHDRRADLVVVKPM